MNLNRDSTIPVMPGKTTRSAGGVNAYLTKNVWVSGSASVATDWNTAGIRTPGTASSSTTVSSVSNWPEVATSFAGTWNTASAVPAVCSVTMRCWAATFSNCST